MATSGVTTFAVSRDSIISRALRILGVLPQGVSPNATQLSESNTALNGLVKALQAEGMPLWAIQEYTLSLSNGVETYRLGSGQTINTPKPLKVLAAYYRHVSSGTDTPMIVITRDEYNRLGNKASAGVPIQLYYDPQRTYGDVKIFPTPDSLAATEYTIILILQRPFEDMVAAGDELDFPQEWFDAITFLLADRLAPEYGTEKDSRADVQRRAMQYKMEALSFGTEEGSFYFQPDIRSY